MQKQHKSLVRCPHCDKNITSLFYNDNGRMTKIVGIGMCSQCKHLYKIKIALMNMAEIK